MALKYKRYQMFPNGVVSSEYLYRELLDIDSKINGDGIAGQAESAPPVIVKKNVNLTAQALGSNFGSASNFDRLGVVVNDDGTYLIVSDGSKFKYVLLDDV